MTIGMVCNKQSKSGKYYMVLLSDCDKDLSEMLWTVIGPGYAHNKDLGYLHRVILSRKLNRALSKGEESDHKNLNKLDNQRENIRLSTSSQNKINRGIQSNNTSGYRGVYYSNKDKIWCAVLCLNRKNKYLGGFHTPEQAAAAYDMAAKEAQGEFFIGNHID